MLIRILKLDQIQRQKGNRKREVKSESSALSLVAEMKTVYFEQFHCSYGVNL
jgi:hypothetical protein